MIDVNPLAPPHLAPLQLVAGAAVGAVAWTFTEYAAHRWILHGSAASSPRARAAIGSVHRHHHRDPNHTATAARIAACAAMAGIGLAGGQLLARALPRNRAFAAVARTAAATFGAGYSVYDMVHWRLHHRAPSTARGRRLRQRHFRHHFGTPGANLGVTTAWWDRRFGTEVTDDRATAVTVPGRHAPDWLSQLGPDFRRAVPRVA